MRILAAQLAARVEYVASNPAQVIEHERMAALASVAVASVIDLILAALHFERMSATLAQNITSNMSPAQVIAARVRILAGARRELGAGLGGRGHRA